jgi:hypothetical protein
MGFLERSLTRRATSRLQEVLEPGEVVLAVDSGILDRLEKVQCVASNRALYIVHRGGETERIAYSTILGTGGGPTWLELNTLAGTSYLIDFGRSARGVSDTVVDHYREHARTRRRVHVAWGSGGATFLLIPSATGEQVAYWKLDPGTTDDMNTSMLTEQALGELEVSLGRSPSLQYASERPSWMGEFMWEPPLDGEVDRSSTPN